MWNHTYLFALIFGLSYNGSAVAQTEAPPNLYAVSKLDRVAYEDGTTFELNRFGQHVYRGKKYTLLFDPVSHTLTNPIRFVTKIDARVVPTADGSFTKTYSTDAVPGSGCPGNLDWNMNYTVTNTIAEVMINLVATPVKVQRSEQKGTWACGNYGSNPATIVVEYAPDLNLVLAFAIDMVYQGRSTIGSTKLLSITRDGWVAIAQPTR